MGKRSLLLVDGDARSLRVLEVSLRKAGFLITTAVNGRDALDKARTSRPDLILSDTDMPEMDGFALCRELKADSDLARVPFVFLTGETAIESKIRGLELGVDEYLTKPIYIKEILTRIRILLQKQQRARLETRRDPNTRFAGTLHDMGVVDLIQTIEVSRKSGLIHFSGADGRQATIYFRHGAVIDAETGHLQGADAVYRLLTWSEGEFELLFRTVRRKDAIDMGTQALLMEGMRRLDEWGRLLEQLPPLATRFDVDVAELAERLSELPDELNHILRLFDGRRSLLDVIDLAGGGDLECIELVSRLYFEGLLHEVEGAPVDLAPEVSTDAALEGWLGRQIPPDDRMPTMDPLPAEVAADAEAEWDASEAEAAAEMMWPSQPVASADAGSAPGADVEASRALEDAGVAIERLVAAALRAGARSGAVHGTAGAKTSPSADVVSPAVADAVSSGASPGLASDRLAIEDPPTPHLAQEAAPESPPVDGPRAADTADPARELPADGSEPRTAEPISAAKLEVASGAAEAGSPVGASATEPERGEFGADTQRLPPEVRELVRLRSGRGVEATRRLAMSGPAEESEEADFEAETGKFPPELRELARRRAREHGAGVGEPVAPGSNGASEPLEDPDFDGDTEPLPPELRGSGRRRPAGTPAVDADEPRASDLDGLLDMAAGDGAGAVQHLGPIAEGKPSGRGVDVEGATPRLFASDGRLFDDDFEELTPDLAQHELGRGREFGADTEELPTPITAEPVAAGVAGEPAPVLRVHAEILRQTGEFPGPVLDGSEPARVTGEFPGPLLDASAEPPRAPGEFPGALLDGSESARVTGEFPGPVPGEPVEPPRATGEFPGPLLDASGAAARVTGEFPGPVMRNDDGLRLTEVLSGPLLPPDAGASWTRDEAQGATARDGAQVAGSPGDLDAEEPPTPPSGVVLGLRSALERDEEPEGVALGRVSLVRRRSQGQERAAELGPDVGAPSLASDEPAWSAGGADASSEGQPVPQPVAFGEGSTALASSSSKTESSDEAVVPPGSVVSDPFDVAAEGASLAAEEADSTAAAPGEPVERAARSADDSAAAGPADGNGPAAGASGSDSSASRSDDSGESSASTTSSTQDSPAASQPLPAAAAAVAVFSLAASGGDDGILEEEFGTGAIADFDTSDLTPLPNPVPLGDERSNPRIKSSRGAEVAMVSGEVAAQPRPTPDPDQADIVALSSRQNGTRPGATGRASTARPVVSPVVPSGGSGNGRLRSVELDQELSAAAEVVELVPPRPAIAVPLPASAEGPAGKMGRGRRTPERGAVADLPADAMVPPPRRPSTRVSAMLRAASGHTLARTVTATIAAAVLVGACFGLLFWWFGARNDPSSEELAAAGSVADGAVAAEAGSARSAASLAAGDDAQRTPIASGTGDMARPSPAAAAAESPGGASPRPARSSAQSSAAAPAPRPASPSVAAPAAAGANGYDDLYEEAKRARRRRDYQAVLSLAARALAQRETAQALTLQAEAMTALGESRRALPIADRATELRPKFSSGWYIKGRIHRTLGETDKARAAFERYLELDPEGTRADQVIDLLQDM